MLANVNNQLILEVKSKYDAEFRRFGMHRQGVNKFEEFYQLVESLHGLNGIQFFVYYTDRDGDLLPINNDNNLARVLNVTHGILRLVIQRKGECYNNGGQIYSNYQNSSNYVSSNHSGNNFNYSNSSSSYRAANLITQIKSLKDLSSTFSGSQNNQKPFVISGPEDFRPVSAIIDVDILPDKYRRIRLNKHKCSKPLGFYIKDGRSLRVTPQGVEQVPGVFISRLMPGGLAESTGLLSVSDEVIEVNGIEVAGKTLDQVTDMMVANSSNLIITVKPSNQRYNLNRSTNVSGTGQQQHQTHNSQLLIPNKKMLTAQVNNSTNKNNGNNSSTVNSGQSSKVPLSNATSKSFDNSGPLKNGANMASSLSGTPNKRAQTETPSVSSVNSSFSSNRATNLADSKHIVDNGQISLDFHNSSSNSAQKLTKDIDDDNHHNDIDEDDDEEIITRHSNGAGVVSNQGSTATSESNSPHRIANNYNNTDLNSSGDDENDNDNSDDKILTL